MAVRPPIEFSPNNEFLAYASPDGVLKVWETASGILKQEYTPSSHLSATCTCMSWSRNTANQAQPKKKKRRSSLKKSDDQHMIAMGTSSGDVLIYSIVAGSLQTQLTGGHTETVNGSCWHSEDPILYTCSSDHHIVEWDVVNSKVKEKWKADKGAVYSVCVSSNKYLLSASRSIKLWDIDGKKQLLKTFTGHATEVFRLIPIPFCANGSAINGSHTDFYFLSAALNDRTVNAWHTNPANQDKNSLASFSLPDEPVVVNISKGSGKDSPLLLSVVTASGHLLVFEHTLNGRMKKPLKPRIHAQIASSNQNDAVPELVPILAAHICEDLDNSLLIAHGSFLKPTFEKLPYDPSQPEVCLIRESALSAIAAPKEKDMTKIKSPDTADATMLAPGHMMRRKRKPSVGDMTMEDRLNAISIEKPGHKKKDELPKADTLINLLSQGLQSNDKTLIERVLHHDNPQIILNTVKRLPVQLIVPFIKAISIRIHSRQSGGAQILLKWLKAVLITHTSYLMTFQEIVDSLSSLYQLMEARVGMFSRLSRLQGKLDLMLSQITSQEQEEEDTSAQQTPLLLYHEESSDDDDPMEDLLASHSESENNWDMEDESEDGESDADD
ncbi:hypothetical protein SNE40_015512 [Patella caerulea]|uniref:Small-subunit processome Utp12 domain-containing protein n=1 Tax=Patella caerulea TaxID=87958 RepID=A0AAN8PVA3_PATCE